MPRSVRSRPVRFILVPDPHQISPASRAADVAAARYLVLLRDRAPEPSRIQARSQWRELVRQAVQGERP